MAAGGLEIIQNMLHRLPQSERKLAEYILKNPHEVVNGTIQEVSSSAKTSGAAAIRLCKSLGLKGFQDLKMRVAGDLMKPSDQGYRDIEPQEPLHSIVQKQPAIRFRRFAIPLKTLTTKIFKKRFKY